jgi:hypothetical protein
VACPSAALSQPFAQWGDSNTYSLVPQGDFEGSLSEWNLSGATKQVAGSESYGVSGRVGSCSLMLPQGASARSPFMCVTQADRRFRFFARSEGSGSTLRVDLVYKIPSGNDSYQVGSLSESGTWQPSESLHTGAVMATEMTDGTAQLALR